MSEDKDEGNGDPSDRSSVVRTKTGTIKEALQDFGVGKITATDSQVYLERKKSGHASSRVIGNANSAVSSKKLRKPYKRGNKNKTKGKNKAKFDFSSTGEKKKGKAVVVWEEGAVWLRLALPLVFLAIAEGISMSPANGSGTKIDGTVLVGIALSISASCANALGLNLQRLGQRPQEGEKGRKANRDTLSLNTIGLILAAASGILDLASFGFAPQSLLAPFAAVTLVVNLILAPLLHDESLTRTDLKATIMVCTGIAIALRFNPATSQHFTYTDIMRLANRQIFKLYLSAYVAALSTLGYTIYNAEREGREEERLIGIAYAVTAGMLGGMTTLNAKLMSELFKVISLYSHPDVLGPVIGLVVVFALSQVTILNRGLGKHSSLVMIPMFSATFLVANIMGGGIFFDEFSSFQSNELVGFLLGVSLVVGGVSTLTTRDEDEGNLFGNFEDDEEEDLDEEPKKTK